MEILTLIFMAMNIALTGFLLFLVSIIEKDVNHLIDLFEVYDRE